MFALEADIRELWETLVWVSSEITRQRTYGRRICSWCSFFIYVGWLMLLHLISYFEMSICWATRFHIFKSNILGMKAICVLILLPLRILIWLSRIFSFTTYTRPCSIWSPKRQANKYRILAKLTHTGRTTRS